MAKQELNWINVQADDLTGEMKKAWDALAKARDAFKVSIEANARKVNAIGKDEGLQIALKPWGFGIAKVASRANRSQTNSNPFASL